MHLSRTSRITLRVVTAVVLAFVYVPLLVVVINSFNPARVAAWPPDGFTAEWWTRAWDNPGARAALWTSVKAAAGATLAEPDRCIRGFPAPRPAGRPAGRRP